MTVLLVALGAAVGAPARLLTDRWVQGRSGSRFPFGTLIVNVAASFVLGLVSGGATSGGWVSADAVVLVGTGFCGALSTFSTFSYEVLVLGRDGLTRVALGYTLVSVVAALGAAAGGWAIGSAL